VLAKENHRLKPVRKKLRDLLESYEDKHWSSGTKFDNSKLTQSELAALIAEKERQFIQRRKLLIKDKLRKLHLNQEQLMLLLGHTSKTYMSELINGVSPFTLNDLIVINRLLKINLSDLVPTTIPQKQRTRIKKSIQAIGLKNIKLSAEDLDFVSEEDVKKT
jgi:hypothetical protein